MGTILDDDQPPPPTISINDIPVTEGNSDQTPATFTISLSAPASSPVTVAWRTANGTATTKNKDYVAASGTASFAPNQSTQTVTVQVIGDTAIEPTETFNVNLSNPVGATLSDGQGAGTIVNDDQASVLHVGDLDGSGVLGRKGTWTANVKITVHDANKSNVAGATVSALWSDATSRTVTCTTDATGACTISKSSIAKQSIGLNVTKISKTGSSYDPVANQDPDGDSNGTAITILKPQ